MTFNCIVSQVHIPDFDVQGQLHYTDKQKIVDLSISHLRKWNPDAYIILTGHGHRPFNDTLNQCDIFDWDDINYPLDDHGYLINMPAQYQYVSKGIKIAKNLGFTRLLKTRGDCVIGIPNITSYCEDILCSENTRILITQQTGDGYLGDCFMYGDMELLDKTWDANNPILHQGGLVNTAMNFARCFPDYDGNWKSLLRRVASFRDVNTLKFSCLRWNYKKFEESWPMIYNSIMNNTIDFESFHFGKINGWNEFDVDGNMIKRVVKEFWSAKEFYND
jgi:hypothetical protein